MSQDTHLLLNRRAAMISVGISLFLVVAKTYAWFVTDSLSLLSSLLDSSMDVVVSVLNMMAIAYAAKPADDDHRFGHDAIEDIVGLVQGVFIGASGLFLIYEAMHRFAQPQPITHASTGIAVLLLSIACTGAIVLYQRYVIRKTGSIVLEADSLHYLTDFLVNGSIIVSLLLASQPGWAVADPVIAVFIAAYIIHSAHRIGKRAFNNLMNRELPDDELAAIKRILETDKEILGYHALKTTRNGSRAFVQLHLDLDENLSLKEAHRISVDVREKIAAVLGNAEITIHEDPRPANEGMAHSNT